MAKGIGRSERSGRDSTFTLVANIEGCVRLAEVEAPSAPEALARSKKAGDELQKKLDRALGEGECRVVSLTAWSKKDTVDMASTETPEPSAALALIRHVEENMGPLSGIDRDHARAAAIRVAIVAALPFNELDWMGLPLEERWYTFAAKQGHLSALRAMERAFEREPFIYRGQRLAIGSSLVWVGLDRSQPQLRGLPFPGDCGNWDGASATVTSFSADGESLTACSYETGADHRSKVRRRYTIPVAGLRKVERARASAIQSLNRVALILRRLPDDCVVKPLDAIGWSAEERGLAAEWADRVHFGSYTGPRPEPPAFLAEQVQRWREEREHLAHVDLALHLRWRGMHVPVAQIASWNDEQRREAASWTSAALHYPKPPAPEHVTAAAQKDPVHIPEYDHPTGEIRDRANEEVLGEMAAAGVDLGDVDGLG